MKEARIRAGLSLEQAALQAHGLYQRATIGRIRQLEKEGMVEADADAALVAALADVYGVPLSQLSPLAEAVLGRVVTLAGASRVTDRYLDSAPDQHLCPAA